MKEAVIKLLSIILLHVEASREGREPWGAAKIKPFQIILFWKLVQCLQPSPSPQ